MIRARPLATLVLVVTVLAATGAIALFVTGRSGGPEGGGGPGGKPDRVAPPPGAAERFLSGHVAGDGRVVRHDQGADTVSEGQAYALAVTAATGDRHRFDLVWTWTRDNLQRPDGLFAWRWQDGRVSDDSPATDADVDIAASLAAGGERFGEPDLVDEARRVAAAVLEHETVEVGGRLALVAGPWARDDRIVNPSYLPCGVAGGVDLAAATGDDRWRRVASDAVDLLRPLVDEGLPPDWAVLDDAGRLRPVAGPDQRDGDGEYGLDAARIPARLSACPGGEEVAAALWDRMRGLDDRGAATAYALDGRRIDDADHAVGLIGAAAAARAAGDIRAARDLVARAAELESQHPTYYGTAWLALGETVLGLGDAPATASGAAGRAGGFGRSAVRGAGPSAVRQPEPTTTVPPATTSPPTTAPPTTTPTSPTTAPTTAPPPPPTTAPGTPPTTGPTGTGTPGTPGTSTTSGGGTTSTSGTTSSPTSTPPSTSGTTAPGGAPEAGGSGRGGTGDLSAQVAPGEELRVEPNAGRRDPGEPARRRIGAIALTGLAVTAGVGAALGLRERTHGMRARRQTPA